MRCDARRRVVIAIAPRMTYVMKKKQMEEEQLTVNNETQHKSVRKRSKRKADSTCCAARAAPFGTIVRSCLLMMALDRWTCHLFHLSQF